MIFIAEGYQPDCDGPVRWIESVHADTIEAAREAVMPVYNASGDLCPDAVFTIEQAREEFGATIVDDMLSKPLGHKESAAPGASYVSEPDEESVPFYYASLNRR